MIFGTQAKLHGNCGHRMFNNAYRNKKVFVTGHTGFKGSWLTLWLKFLGAEVKGYALKPRTPRDLYNVTSLKQQMGESYNDVRDFETLKNQLTHFSPDLVFHLAAQPLVRESYIYPRETFDVNVMGTVNLLTACKDLPNLKGIVNITSDKCYENNDSGVPFKESDPMGGFDPYSASKGAAEVASQSFRRSFFEEANTLMANVRAGNVIGGGDWCKDRIVTDTIEASEQRRPVELRNPNAIRPWQHVLEPLSGYLLWGSKAFSPSALNFSSGWNFGPMDESHVTVRTLVSALQSHLSFGEIKDLSEGKQPHEAKALKLNIEKAKTQLNWTPCLNINEAAEWTATWYDKFLSNPKQDMTEFTQKQIVDYVQLAKTRNLEWTN